MLTMTDKPTDHASDVMDIHEVAAALGLNEQTISRMIRRGDLKPLPRKPLVRRQPKWLFNRAYIERLARGESPTTDEG